MKTLISFDTFQTFVSSLLSFTCLFIPLWYEFLPQNIPREEQKGIKKGNRLTSQLNCGPECTKCDSLLNKMEVVLPLKESREILLVWLTYLLVECCKLLLLPLGGAQKLISEQHATRTFHKIQFAKNSFAEHFYILLSVISGCFALFCSMNLDPLTTYFT